LNNHIQILESRTFKYGVVELRSDDILTYTPNKDVKSFDIPQLKQAVDIFLEFTNGNPKLYFCDMSHFTDKTSSETDVYMKSTLHLFAKACAATQKSTYVIYLAHVFLHLYKPDVPVKLFKTKPDAIAWLKSINI
jgi:hypothetical protein